jgi:hypothetical protein
MNDRDDEDCVVDADDVHDREWENSQDLAPSAVQVGGPLVGTFEDAGKGSFELVSESRRQLSTVCVTMFFGALTSVALRSAAKLGPSVRVNPVLTGRRLRRARRWRRSARRL